ncbi:hypothetical protein [Deinococcus psychrotolerans]|uniref:hypothetical protein n=1 Tax=Deinococcus psychrotolerans TaxID=2489213 RepID=UPI0013DE1B59|nr:hypothetical protein [Deinococcus psychrotolerans]
MLTVGEFDETVARVLAGDDSHSAGFGSAVIEARVGAGPIPIIVAEPNPGEFS